MSDLQPPVTKVGAVVVRADGHTPQVLVVQPKPKAHTPKDLPPLGLPRGTRMYKDPATGQFIDADHDGKTQPPEGAQFEAVQSTFYRELEEETGIHPVVLEKAKVVDMGVHIFPSRKKEPYPIHWFAVLLPKTQADAVSLDGMADSLHAQWTTLLEMQLFIEQRKMSPGYVGVAELALKKLGLLG